MAEYRHIPQEHNVVVDGEDEHYHDHASRNSEERDILEEYAEKPAPPKKRPFYKTKKYWIICAVITVIVVIVVVLLALYVFFPMIAQSLMNKAGIDVNSAQITFNKPTDLNGLAYRKRDGDDLNSTFYMNMESSLKNTGPFSASIKFKNPVEVYYNDTLLGDIYLYNETHISGGKGSLNAITPFLIKDQTAFANFAKDMLAVEEFKWTLKGKLDITALTRTAEVKLDKEITLNGMNGFPNVKISSFQLPGDAPGGGILVELGTVLTSPSPIGVQLGTIGLTIGYDGITLGNVQAENVNLQKGDNEILLKGTLIPQNDTTALTKVGNLFSNYVSGVSSNTSAVGVYAAPDGVNPISWLSEGFKTVQLNVALGSAQPLNIINAVSMGYLDLKFDPSAPYAPVATAPTVTANFQIPFGFSLDITEVSQNITLGINSTGSTTTSQFAVIEVPYVPAVSNQSTGVLQFAINNGAIAGLPGQESVFNEYTYDLTSSANYTFMVAGNASTKTVTPIGNITLGGITFTLPTSLHGLEFLNSSATVINSLDVTGGTTDNLLLSISVSMQNPSDFSISTGDVNFVMSASNTDLGVVTLNNLTLARGSNTVLASATFNPKVSDVGQNLLSTFVMGQDNGVSIKGFSNSTVIASLANALGNISIDSTLPGLKTALIQGGALTVLTDTPTTGVVGVQVTIANPFSAGLAITTVTAAATFNGMPVGNINQDISSNPFTIPGNGTAQSQQLSMTMNVEPASVALLLRNLAIAGNLDTTALDALLTLGGFSVDGQEHINGDSSTFAGFNISTYVLDAMKALKVDLALTSGLTIGQYTNDLTFSQASVAIATDNSVLILIPIVGQPIVQQIVDGAVLGFETIILSSPTDNAFTVQMKGSITGTGPMDATISFPSPLTVAWEGSTLGTVTMPEIQAKADVGASFDVTGTFTISDTNAMATFAAYLINNENFVWDISTANVAVNALGYTFTGITMQKSVTLLGANGFKNAVTINKFDLPANDPAGGITLTADTTIKNPSQVGFNLAGVSFETFFGSVDLGPLASNGAAVFSPLAASNVAMVGRLIPQTTSEGLAAITEVFENYLSGKSSLLDIKGVSGSGPNGVVGWLSTAFKELTIEDVVLPGPAAIPQLISSITMQDMNLDFTQNPWAPPTGSENVVAQLKSPFGFPLGVSQLNMDVAATYEGATVATLAVPDEAATTSSTGLVHTQFANVPFKVVDKKIFSGFVQLLTLSPSVTFGLEGSTNAIAETAVGALSLKNITFDVDTTLAGFNDFGGTATIISIDVVDGTSAYALADISFSLNNPSNITITVGDINFDVVMNEFNAVVGRVYVPNAVIPPGSKTYSAQLHLGEGSTSSQAIGQLFSDYLTAATIPLTIQGSSASTAIAPLVPALSSVKLASTMTGIQANLVKQISVKGSIIGLLIQNKAEAVITLENPLTSAFAITKVQAAVTFTPTITIFGSDPYTVGTIDYDLSSNPQTVPGKGSATTDGWPVSIVHDSPLHLLQLVELLIDPEKYFFVEQNVTVTVGGANGYETSMYYYQAKVPFSITIDDLITIGITVDDLDKMKAMDLSGLGSLDSSAFEATIKGILSGSLFKAAAANTTNTTTTLSTSSTTTTLTSISSSTTGVTSETTTSASTGSSTTGSSSTTTSASPSASSV